MEAVLWHGSDVQFEQFVTQGTTYLGIYASAAKDYAAEYGRYVRPLAVEIRNPFIIDIGDRSSPHYTSTQGEIVMGNRIVGFYRRLDTAVIRRLEEAGHDGILVNFNAVKGFEVVAFMPSQVTWAGEWAGYSAPHEWTHADTMIPPPIPVMPPLTKQSTGKSHQRGLAGRLRS